MAYPGYQDYKLEPTPAQLVWGPRFLPASATLLSTEAEAAAIGSELGVTPAEALQDVTGRKYAWNGEARREWEIVVDGQRYNIGVLMQAKSLAGVGYPGKWSKESGSLEWTPDPAPKPVPPPTPPAAERPPLGPNEEYKWTPFGFAVQPKEVPASAPASADVTEIRRLVTAMAEMLGIR